MILEVALILAVLHPGPPVCPDATVGISAEGNPSVRCVVASREFVDAITRVVPCEGKYAADPQHPDLNVGWNAVGADGEIGPPQLHPMNIRALQAEGWPTTQEWQWFWAERMWREQALAPWSGARNPKCKEE